MPKDKNNGREMTPDEKFRSFFSTTAVTWPFSAINSFGP